MLTYLERAKLCNNPVAIKLLSLMDAKKTNLSVSVDVTRKEELLSLANSLGPSICVLKTHIDILEDFDNETVTMLQQIAKQHNFIIFEDRKFADIGNTASLQYEKGIYHIADWAQLTNAHSVAGADSIASLKKVGLQKNNAMLLVAEMSSQGNLAHGYYTAETVQMASQYSDFVIGFICQHKLTENPTFIHFTPGIKFSGGEDAQGQQYRTPHQAIVEAGIDIIIVGRGIYTATSIQHEAKKYQEAGWEAYLQKMSLL
ncbi:MAG: orotidine-5'-phosphate decarboxylase [Gammaproteobacteria bacterium]|nr:orotidine-5'-phosphate decarboxylase [Gammaproteobacteria bacterium]